MLEWLVEKPAALRLIKCLRAVREAGITTADLGGSAATRNITAAVVKKSKTRLGAEKAVQ